MLLTSYDKQPWQYPPGKKPMIRKLCIAGQSSWYHVQKQKPLSKRPRPNSLLSARPALCCQATANLVYPWQLSLLIQLPRCHASSHQVQLLPPLTFACRCMQPRNAPTPLPRHRDSYVSNIPRLANQEVILVPSPPLPRSTTDHIPGSAAACPGAYTPRNGYDVIKRSELLPSQKFTTWLVSQRLKG